ncbi:MAG TPA: 4Fe-4S dicluster domain-containing protein, partial [Polyangiaceae bacterium]|nr:4Fe-4S dicluster domain-containing protein [Polyangiaceae bacterium]
PYTHRPEDLVEGRPVNYATSVPFYGTAVGLLVESTDGRPTKIEGNPDHPDSRGGTTAFLQALLLDLYDPDRSTSPGHAEGEGFKALSAAEADAEIEELAAAARAKNGEGLALLVGDHRSPSVKASLDALLRLLPGTQLYRFDAFGRESSHAGLERAFGARREAVYDLEAADVIVTLDADILATESSPIKNAKAYSRRRRPEERGEMSRLYVVEPSPTPTGMTADHRIRMSSRAITDFAKAIAAGIDKAGVKLAGLGDLGAAKLGEKEAKAADIIAKDLVRAKGKSLVVVGRRQPPALHALAAALNHALGNIGTTVRYVRAFDDLREGPDGLKALVDSIAQNKVETLFILGTNPVFNAPADLLFEAALKKVKNVVHASSHVDETSRAATLHVPRAHVLESWGDTSAEDGTLAITQPLIAPMYGGKTDLEIIEKLAGGMRTPYELVMQTWGRVLGAQGFDKAFRRAIHDGVHGPGPDASDSAPLALDEGAVGDMVRKLAPPPGEFEVLFAPCPHAWDGRFANNGWMQEAPDPIHKGTWMTMASLSHATATRLGVEDGDHVDVTVGGVTVTVPAVVSFGHADDAVTLPVGQGRRSEGRVQKGVGVDTQVVRGTPGWDAAVGTVKKGSGHTKLAVTQGHFVMEGRPLIRTQTVEEYKAEPGYMKEMVEHPPLQNLFADWTYEGFKWGLVVDLTLCTGCSACVTACMAENNIPVLGITGTLKSREMHWLRIDRYFAGKDGIVEGADDAEAAAMPMTCQHCENAPCEQVCPVAATTHSPEGINEMTYNRCIGTKYCGNNCPFKVRRFNFFNYTKDIPETQKLGLNPDVTVRSRGVMEKCSMCVQRINQAKIAAKKETDPKAARDIIRGIQTACQQACPSEAILFGDMNDRTAPARSVARLAKPALEDKGGVPRAYHMLEEINVRPRLSYLGRIQNKNPELEPPTHKSAETRSDKAAEHTEGEAH